VKELEAKDSIVPFEAMHAEGTPQHGIPMVCTPDGVELARNREGIMPGDIDCQPIAVLCNLFVF
jgi:hypothetical protein